MKRLLLWVGTPIILIIVAFVALLFLSPGTVLNAAQSMAARSAGLKAQVIDIDGYQVHYLIGGTGPDIVMLHGLGDDKNSFVTAAGDLTDSYRVILPDLPGHGENAFDANRDYSIAGNVDFLTKFFAALELEQFTLVGNSMGGHTSAAYAVNHGDSLNNLVLINAAGLYQPDHPVYRRELPPIPSREAFNEFMKGVVYEPPSLPGPLADEIIANFNARAGDYSAINSAIIDGDMFDLTDMIGQIDTPTLILWGEHDQVVSMPVADGYASGIPDATLFMIDDASHSPQIDKGDVVAANIRDFLGQ